MMHFESITYEMRWRRRYNGLNGSNVSYGIHFSKLIEMNKLIFAQ